MTADSHPPASSSRSFRPARVSASLLALYACLVIASFVSGGTKFGDAAVFTLITLLLAPGMLRWRMHAWTLWLAALAGGLALMWFGGDRLALDLMPVMINAVLCAIFARTLTRGRQPLVARAILALEGPERLALPGVASYARKLTLTWALLLGVQATVLLILVLCDSPGIGSPIALRPNLVRWYLHVGSYAVVVAFMLVEYGFRRWHMRGVPHPPFGQFCVRLAQRWPALVREDPPSAPRGRP
ncbi:MAG: xanthomonadin biosynthesis protein [Rhodanobacteraceae bacterium]